MKSGKNILVTAWMLGALLAAPAAMAVTAYPYGNLPSSAADAALASAYSTWKSRRLVTGYCANSLRVDNGGGTYSEGMGYGMLMAAYLDADSTNLTKLYNFYIGTLDNNGLMNWSVTACGNNNSNAASDGDVDMAQAMVEAHLRWPSEGWDTKAKTLLNKIYTYEVDTCKGLKPGDVWGGCPVNGKDYNPSYFCTSYFKNWDCFEGGTRWSAVRDKCYVVLNAGVTAGHALPPDWVNANGLYFSGSYGYDACRTPWRVGLDYLWFGDSRSKTLSDKWASNFAPGGAGAGGNSTAATAAAYIGDGYSYSSGARTSSNHQNEFMGAIAIASMASAGNAAFCDAVYNEVVNKDNNSYFSDSLKVLYLMVLTGKFRDAACNICTGCSPTPSPTRTPSFSATPTPTPAFSLAKSANVSAAAVGQTFTYYLSYKNLSTGPDTTGVTSGVTLEFSNGGAGASGSSSNLNFRINNASGSTISLANYRIRYFLYDASHTATTDYTTYAYNNPANGTAAMVAYPTYTGTRSANMEFRVTWASGTVATGSSQVYEGAVSSSGYSWTLTFTDDWSYPGSASSYSTANAAYTVLEENVGGTWKLAAGSYPGGSTSITGVSITDTLDSRLTLLSVAPANSGTGQNVSVYLASLSPGASGNVTITAYVNATASAGGTVSNTGSIGASGYPSAGSNTHLLSIGAGSTSTFTATRTPSPTATRTASPSPSATATLTPSPTASPSGTSSATPSASSSRTPTFSATASPSASFTVTPGDTATSSATPTSSGTASPTRTATGTATGSPTRSFTPSASPSFTVSGTVTDGPSPTATLSHTASPTASDTPSPSASGTPSPSASATRTVSPSPSATATNTEGPSPTASSTFTTTVRATDTSTLTATPTATRTPTASGTVTPTGSGTPTVTAGATASATATNAASATVTSTRTAQASAVPSGTGTVTLLASATATSTRTPQPSAVPSGTRTVTAQASATASPASSPARTPGGQPEVIKVYPLPNPNPTSLWVQLAGHADAVQVRVYTKAMVHGGTFRLPGGEAGWNRIPLPDQWGRQYANGVYYIVVQGMLGSQVSEKTVLSKVLIMK